MGTSLSGLTPATTFDGLLKVGDNDPLTAGLKAISTGDGTDTILQLSNSALSIGGETIVEGATTGEFFKVRNASNPSQEFYIEKVDDALNRFNAGTDTTYITYRDGAHLRFVVGGTTHAQLANTGDLSIGLGGSNASARMHIKGSGATSATTSLLVQNSAGTELIALQDDGATRINLNNTLKLVNNSGSTRVTFDGEGNLGIRAGTPLARLHVRGAGLNSATTSLLVTDSAGADLLKVTDDGAIDFSALGLEFSNDGSGGTMSVASDRYVKIATSLSTYSALNAHIFKTLGSGGYSEAMRITGNTDQFVGIGETTPTAKLHIKGDGSSAATTSLLVQNSSGNNLINAKNDGEVTIGSTMQIRGTDISAYNSIALKTYTDAGWTTNLLVTGNGATSNVGIGEITPTAKLHVKGSGNDNTTTALLVQNSDGTDTFKVLDDGNVQVAEYIYPADGTTNSRFRVSNSAGTYMYYSTGNLKLNPNLVYTSTTYGTVFSVSNSTGDFSLNGATGAKMAIKGNGATSATTALLVENSAGTEALKVRDDGKIFFNGLNLVIEGKQIYNANTSNGFLKLNANRLEYSDSSTSGLDSSAALTVTSTTRGFLPPRMTDAERDAITNPAAGLMVYDTSNNQMNYWNGSTWIAF